MAELTAQERLQPCLLDRLTDEQPGDRQESRDRRVVNIRQMRHAVLRDLIWLLNSSAHLDPEDAAEFPEVARSVLNFGIPDLCGMTASHVDPGDVSRLVQDAVRRFEPRILPRTLRVAASTERAHGGPTAISFEIRGDLWAQPTPEPLFLRTEVDLDTGHCSLREGGGANG
ncbi:MAG: type VI secretion system baseplate subunit TssE [Phycisphaerales bacterium]